MGAKHVRRRAWPADALDVEPGADLLRHRVESVFVQKRVQLHIELGPGLGNDAVSIQSDSCSSAGRLPIAVFKPPCHHCQEENI
jgi:hypothetical protein